MRTTKLLKSGQISEEAIHRTVMEWVSLHRSLRGLVLHFPNEGKRTKRYGKLLNDLGMRAGVSDLFIAMGRQGHLGAWIELKSADGKVSIAQQKFIDDMIQQNYFAVVCWSVEEAINIISWYCEID